MSTTPNFRLQKDIVADNTSSTGVSSVYNRAQVVKRVTLPSNAGAVDATLTNAQVFGGLLYSTHATGATITLTTPTAALLYAACPQFQVGDTFDLTILNLAPGAGDTVTLAGGAGVTSGAGSLIVAISTNATFQFRFTGVPSAPTFQIYRTA